MLTPSKRLILYRQWKCQNVRSVPPDRTLSDRQPRTGEGSVFLFCFILFCSRVHILEFRWFWTTVPYSRGGRYNYSPSIYVYGIQNLFSHQREFTGKRRMFSGTVSVSLISLCQIMSSLNSEWESETFFGFGEGLISRVKELIEPWKDTVIGGYNLLIGEQILWTSGKHEYTA